MTSTALFPKRELWLLITLAGIQFTHIVDFMVMMPLGPQVTKLFNITDAEFGLLVSSYTFVAVASGLLTCAVFYPCGCLRDPGVGRVGKTKYSASWLC